MPRYDRRSYADLVDRGRAQHGARFSEASLEPSFVRWYESGDRVRGAAYVPIRLDHRGDGHHRCDDGLAARVPAHALDPLPRFVLCHRSQ